MFARQQSGALESVNPKDNLFQESPNARNDATQMMRAHVITAHGSGAALQAIAIPTPGPGEILIRVAACGVCHSDIHAVDGRLGATLQLAADPWP